MDVLEAINTTRAMRRLDIDRNVSTDDIHTMLEAAGRAANGSDLQPVRWIVVRDAALRRALGDLYREIALELSGPASAPPPKEDRSPRARLRRSVDHLVRHYGEAPVLIIACAAGEPGRIEPSVYPAVQNLMLAARALGLGTTLTTRLRMRAGAVRTLLGIPDDVHLFAAIPVGYPLGKWGEGPRRPVEELTFGDRWGEPLQE